MYRGMRQFKKHLFILRAHKTDLLNLMVESLYLECTQDNKTWH